MKATGIVRRVDELGRVVVPMEIRRTHDIAVRDSVEIFVDGDSVILRKYAPGCALCGDSSDGMRSFKGKYICQTCNAALGNL